MGRHGPVRGRAAIVLLTLVVACGGRETLLQLDVIMPEVAIASLEITVAESERRMAAPATFPRKGQILGVDVRLPASLTGQHLVTLLARDGRSCHVAEAGLMVELVAGEKIHPPAFELRPLAEPVCDANGMGDGGVAPDPADADELDTGAGDDGAAGPSDVSEDGPAPGPEDVRPGAPDVMADVRPPADAAPPRPDAAPPNPDAGQPQKPDVAPPVDMRPPEPAPPRCDAAGNCPAGLNCVANGICAAAATCAQIKTQKPGAADGVYWLQAGGARQQAYCDMALGVVLCDTSKREHQGRVRIGPAVPFKLSSVLNLSQGTCEIWAVRHAGDGYPFDKINGASTCAALGFKPGDEGILAGASRNRSCPYGANPAPYSDCGFGGPDHRFGGRGFYKWGNTCTGCSPRITMTGYFKQGPIYASDIHWDMTGRVSNFCKVR